MKAVTLSKEDVFKGSTNRNVLSACSILTSKILLDGFIKFAEKLRSEKMPF